MSFAMGHFCLGASLSLIIFRAIDYHSEKIRLSDYLRYDILIASIGGLWAMIPDLPSIWGVMDELFGGILCNIFFFHCLLDEYDSQDSILFSAIMFGLFLLTINVINFQITSNGED